MNLFPESGLQATGLCSTQCQFPPRRLYSLTDGVGNCIRDTDAARHCDDMAKNWLRMSARTL